jgi:hypothetical protein
MHRRKARSARGHEELSQRQSQIFEFEILKFEILKFEIVRCLPPCPLRVLRACGGESRVPYVQLKPAPARRPDQNAPHAVSDQGRAGRSGNSSARVYGAETSRTS